MNWFDLASPWWLLVLFALAGLIAGYVYMQRRRHNRALKFANLDLLNRVAPKTRNRAQHIPIVLMVLALAVLVVAMAGPQADRKVPRNKATVILVIDVSRSMDATDVSPSRLKAAQEAGKRFADELTEGINLGLVSFAGTATTLVSPTPNRQATKDAIDKLTLDDKTATGEGILAAITQIKTLNAVLGGDQGAPPAQIVLLSDGKETVPDDPDDPRGAFTAARKAKEERIPVNTISFGTETGSVDLEGDRIPVPVDDESLQKIAQLSGGRFFTASSLDELNEVYKNLQNQIGYETQRGDASRPWLIVGTLLVLAAAASAVAINRRLP
ncbi:UNVERIFIED_CONTAM: Ca-activated chloride channel family protein [Williamsia faeni]